jgi:uncharacterized protein (DUF433 family)
LQKPRAKKWNNIKNPAVAKRDWQSEKKLQIAALQSLIKHRVEFVMNWKEHIVNNPEIMVGKPVIKGTRLTVEFILDLLAQGWTEEEILNHYTVITREDIHACISYAQKV